MFELHNTRYVSGEKSDTGCRSSGDYSSWRVVLKFSGGGIKTMFCNNIVCIFHKYNLYLQIWMNQYFRDVWEHNLFQPTIWFIGKKVVFKIWIQIDSWISHERYASKEPFSYFQISNSCIAFLLQYHIFKIISLKITQPLSLYWRNNGNYGLNTKVCTLLRESWTQTGWLLLA